MRGKLYDLWKAVAPAVIVSTILWVGQQIQNNSIMIAKTAECQRNMQEEMLRSLQSINNQLGRIDGRNDQQDVVLKDHEGRLIRLETTTVIKGRP